MTELPERNNSLPKAAPVAGPSSGRRPAANAVTVGPEANAPVLMPPPEVVRMPSAPRLPLAPPAPPAPARVPPWLERSELFIRVILLMYIGLFTSIAPWWTSVWDLNPLFVQFPVLAHFAALGAVRGVVSGLGLLTLWILLRDVSRQQQG